MACFVCSLWDFYLTNDLTFSSMFVHNLFSSHKSAHVREISLKFGGKIHLERDIFVIALGNFVVLAECDFNNKTFIENIYGVCNKNLRIQFQNNSS